MAKDEKPDAPVRFRVTKRSFLNGHLHEPGAYVWLAPDTKGDNIVRDDDPAATPVPPPAPAQLPGQPPGDSNVVNGLPAKPDDPSTPQ